MRQIFISLSQSNVDFLWILSFSGRKAQEAWSKAGDESRLSAALVLTAEDVVGKREKAEHLRLPTDAFAPSDPLRIASPSTEQRRAQSHALQESGDFLDGEQVMTGFALLVSRKVISTAGVCSMRARAPWASPKLHPSFTAKAALPCSSGRRTSSIQMPNNVTFVLKSANDALARFLSSSWCTSARSALRCQVPSQSGPFDAAHSISPLASSSHLPPHMLVTLRHEFGIDHSLFRNWASCTTYSLFFKPDFRPTAMAPALNPDRNLTLPGWADTRPASRVEGENRHEAGHDQGQRNHRVSPLTAVATSQAKDRYFRDRSRGVKLLLALSQRIPVACFQLQFAPAFDLGRAPR
ncbi:hypothetical protein DFH06DRAFT_1322584 [Mycena polygramma]|nr:hypothetical protein DFH06DRAFT_1322584 [Mycena polygramma]